MRINKLIPSMYQRRLLLLGTLFGIVMLAPLARVAQVSIAKGSEYRERAEQKLVNESWLPTTRGRIVDRNGRVLAFDRPTFDIAVQYSVIRGDWTYKQAARKARSVHRQTWPSLSPEQRDALIEDSKQEFRDRVEGMWDRVSNISGVPREQINAQLADIRRQVDLLAVNVSESNRRARINQIRKDMEKLAKKHGETAAAIARGAEQIEELENAGTADFRPRLLTEETIPQVVLRGVSETVGFAFKRIAEEDERAIAAGEPAQFPGLRIFDSGRREYPLETMQVEFDRSVFPGALKSDAPARVTVTGVATHLLGWMRHQVQAKDETDRADRREERGETGTDRGRYFAGDSVGAWGIEAGAEDTLRGLRGLQTRHLDSGEIDTLSAAPGGDVQLTIDAQLQARLHALFSQELGFAVVQPWHKSAPRPGALPPVAAELPIGTPLNGAIVVVDVATGDILSMVSHPTFGRADLATASERVWNDTVNVPYLNRALSKSYQPGSIVKPLVLAGAVTMGRVGLTETVDCNGKFYPELESGYQCWAWKQFKQTHGPLEGAEAIQRSCNIYFYEMGRRLTPRGIAEVFHRFGVDIPRENGWRLGVGDEFAGIVKDPARAELNEAVLMGIGQGPIAWTPLHAADAYATLGRGGVRIIPRIRTDAAVRRQDLALDRSAVDLALQGLRWSAERDGGTTHTVYFTLDDGTRIGERIFSVPGITVWAKSGTADVDPFKADLNKDGEAVRFDGDHAWCVLLCGDQETPRYAISVVIDYGGSGGRVAGPIANQVIHALVAEGYLPNVNPSETSTARAN